MQFRLHYLLAFCTCLFSLSCSVPTESFHEQDVLTQEAVFTPTRHSSLFTKICSGLIERIWPHVRRPNVRLTKANTASTSTIFSRYGDDVVLRFKIKTTREAELFAEAVNTLYLDVWEATKDWADVRISRKILPSFLTLLPDSMQQSHELIISDLSQAVHATFPSPSRSEARLRTMSKMPSDMFFEDYQPLSVLYPWLRLQASLFPEKSQLFTIGTSFEGRDIPALRIGFEPEENSKPRDTVLIMAGAHAREWISTSTTTYLIRSLLHNGNPHNRRLMESLLTHFDFVFVPTLNPDGYEYTWTTDRLWRKNRQDTSLPFCRGIDLDRAFPFGWDGDQQYDNPCSESYAGEHPLQALEAQRLVEWAKNETKDGKRVFRGLLDLHSYSQEVLYPYSYTCERRPSNLEDLEEVAIGLAKAFRLTSGHWYGVDSACEGSVTLKTPDTLKSDQLTNTHIEESGGSALDFFYQEVGIKHAFQIKLRDIGSYGFLLPKENIVPTGTETFNALLGFGKWLLGNRGIEHYSEMSSDDIWGKDEVIINEYNDQQAIMHHENDLDEVEDDSFWSKRRRR